MEGIERIKKLAEESKSQNIKRVAEYLVNREDLDEKFLNKEKDLVKMWGFIRETVKEKAENGCAFIPDEEVYSLAVHYWDESNEDLGLEKKKTDKSKKKEKAEPKVVQTTEAEEKEETASKEPKHKDDDIVMRYRGRDVTYKEFMNKSYLEQ